MSYRRAYLFAQSYINISHFLLPCFMYMLPINGQHFGKINIVPKWVSDLIQSCSWWCIWLLTNIHQWTDLTRILSSLVGHKLSNKCLLPTKMRLTLYKIEWLIWTYKLRQLHRKSQLAISFCNMFNFCHYFSVLLFNTILESHGFYTVNILSAHRPRNSW